jgi:hypothetical protein
MLKKKAEEEKKNSLSLSLQEWRKARTTAADISQIFPLALPDKEQIDHKTSIKHNIHKRIFFLLLLFLLVLSWSIYTLYRPYVYTRETIIIHVMWAAHSWTDEPIYKHIYSTRHLIHSPDDDEKLHFKDLISFFSCFSPLWCRSVSNELNKLVRACSLFNYPCYRGFLTVLITLALSDSSCLFANDSFFFFSLSLPPLLVFFCIAC